MSVEPRYDLAGNVIEETEVSLENYDDSMDDTTVTLSIPDEAETIGIEEFGAFMDKHHDDKSDLTLDTIISSVEHYQEEVNLLNSLYYTISNEGVSQQDIQTLKKLQTRLFGEGNIPQGLGIEEFDELLFTEERSSVSLSVANESFLATMVQTVKDWIKKIIEFIGRMIEWVAKNIWSEARFENQMRLGVKRYELAKDARVKAETLANTQSKTKPIMLKYASELLNSDRIQINFATLAAFGNEAVTKEIAEYSKLTIKASTDLSFELKSLKTALESNQKNVTMSMTTINRITDISSKMDEIVRRHSNMSVIASKVNTRVFETGIPERTKQVTPFEQIAKQYSNMRDVFKSVRKVNNEKNITYLVDYMNQVMKAITDIGKILSAIRDINNIKLQVVSIFLNYENHYANLIMRIIKENTNDGDVIKGVGDIFDNARNGMK